MNKIEKLIAELCPEGVVSKELGEICVAINAGGDLPEKYLKGQLTPTKEFPYPIYSNGSDENALYGYTDSYKVDCEAVTISARGTIGYHAVRAGKFTPIVRLITLIPKIEIVTSKFLNYALDITDIGHSGGSIPQLTVPNVKKIKIPIPPIDIQQEIVKILDTFTTLEAELEAELEVRKKQYEYYRDELLTFGDDACLPDRQVEWKTLGEVAEIGTGSHDTQDAIEDGKYTFYARGREPLKLNVFDFDETAIITAGDGAGVGKVYHYVQGKYALHQRAYRIVPGKVMESRFVYYYIASYFYAYIQKAAVSSSVTSLRRPMFLNFPVPVPSLSEQARIVTILDKFDALVNGTTPPPDGATPPQEGNIPTLTGTPFQEGNLSASLPAELNARRKQYEYYRNKLLTFKEYNSPPPEGCQSKTDGVQFPSSGGVARSDGVVS